MKGAVIHLSGLSSTDYDDIIEVWEGAVRETHHFLSEEDILFLKPLVRDSYLDRVSLYGIRADNGRILAFMGIDGTKLEMLFIAAAWRGMGLGKMLLDYAVEILQVTEVDVNEQNPEAAGFYEHCGFEVVGHDPLDGEGNPFPILHLRLKGEI